MIPEDIVSQLEARKVQVLGGCWAGRGPDYLPGLPLKKCLELYEVWHVEISEPPPSADPPWPGNRRVVPVCRHLHDGNRIEVEGVDIAQWRT